MDKSEDKVLLLEALAEEVRQSFYLFKGAVESRGVFDEIGRWGGVILGLLSRESSKSIPQLLESLPLSRQYIQKEVSKLTALGLVEAIDNPSHKSSKLLKCTAEGISEYERRRGLYLSLYDEIADDFCAEELMECLAVINKVDRVLRQKSNKA